jgi:hypothetical protein
MSTVTRAHGTRRYDSAGRRDQILILSREEIQEFFGSALIDVRKYTSAHS